MSTIEEHNILRYEPHSVVSERMGFVRSRTGFFIGDPSYVLSKHIYYDIWCDELHFAEGLIHLRGGTCFGVGRTAHGDGLYLDNKRNFYAVSSGMFGIIPLEHVKDRHCDRGVFIYESGTAWFSHDKGIFDFYLPSHSHLHIDTANI